MSKLKVGDEAELVMSDHIRCVVRRLSKRRIYGERGRAVAHALCEFTYPPRIQWIPVKGLRRP